MLGWMTRGIALAAKIEECPACGQIGPHVIAKKTYWLVVFFMPVLLLWQQYGLACTECGHFRHLARGAVLAALRSGRLPLDVARPRFHAATEYTVASSADWAELGLAPGASESAMRSQFRTLAKELHPDKGGDASEFASLASAYERLRATASGVRSAGPREDELFDEIALNPRRGFFDMYSRVSPFLAVLFVLGVGVANVAADMPADKARITESAGLPTATHHASPRISQAEPPRGTPAQRTPRPVTRSPSPSPAPVETPTLAPEPIAAAREVWVTDMVVGDCFGQPTDTDGIGWVTVVDCRSPHAYEVFHLVEVPSSDGEYPGDDAVGLLSLAICTGSRFEDYVGTSYESSRYYITSIDPGAENWARGDREVVCLLNLGDLGEMTGSARGSRQ